MLCDSIRTAYSSASGHSTVFGTTTQRPLTRSQKMRRGKRYVPTSASNLQTSWNSNALRTRGDTAAQVHHATPTTSAGRGRPERPLNGFLRSTPLTFLHLHNRRNSALSTTHQPRRQRGSDHDSYCNPSQIISCETDGASDRRADESTRRLVAEVASEVSSQYLRLCDF